MSIQKNDYKNFSWKVHKSNWKLKIPNICKFELSFGCGLHCRHCYTDCYNNTGSIRKELSTGKIKNIIDKLFNSGVLWICFTGGDPLSRPDFLEIYSYAKKRGFIIIVYTNGFSMTEKFADYFKKNPPFAVEITLNSVNSKTYEYMSGVKGSYEKTMNGINLSINKRLPLKLKTHVTKDNIKEIPQIRKFVNKLGIKFDLKYDLFPRLNGDLKPCSLRIKPEEVISLYYGRRELKLIKDRQKTANTANTAANLVLSSRNIFNCAAVCTDGIYINPYGNLFVCNAVREPSYHVFTIDIQSAYRKLTAWAENKIFTTQSKCKTCEIRLFCNNCPGNALLEAGNLESSIPYYCSLAQLEFKRRKTI